MWRTHRVTLVALLFICPAAWSADLSKVNRTIGKLPQFVTDKPGYCLLVFGPDAAKRVWLVQDGGVLYVDRNGNGDLTEPGERVAADTKSSDPEQEVFSFLVGDIADGSLLHKDLHVYRGKLDHLRDSDPEVRDALARNPKFRACSVAADIEMPSQRGAGLGGRVSQSAMIRDDRGLLQFPSRPEDAPVIHFGGPWTVTLAGREYGWRIGRSQEVYLVMGTPGIGPGSTADVAFDKVIPNGLAPRLQIKFPPALSGQAAVVEYDLTRRCCGVNLYGDVAVPEGVGAGTAKVQISLASWPGVDVASSQHEVEVVPAKPGPKLEPVSSRLVSKLEHEHPKSSISGIRFSPDSQRLIAGDYPGGLVHVWDLASGKRLATMDAGEGLRGTSNYFNVSPDWQKVIAWQEGKGTFEKIERDGKTLQSVEYHSVIRSWSIDGSFSRTYQQTPTHGIRFIDLAPNGKYFLTLDEIPGEFETSRPRALTLWDTATGENRQVASGNAVPGVFSPDSRFVAVSMPLVTDESYTASIKIFAVPEWKEKCAILFDGGQTYADGREFAAAGKILAGTVRTNDKPDDFQHFRAKLMLWDATTGKEILSIPAESKDEGFGSIKASPDGKMIVATTYARKASVQGWKIGPERLVIVDVARKTWKTVDFVPRTVLGQTLFHPGGQWLVLSTSVMSESQGRNASPEEMPQPRINLIDLATGQTVETLVAPQGYVDSLAFSPDGSTLATSGEGAVLLWDFHQAPGAAPTAPEQRIGQLMQIVGQTADGEKFDSDALRGKVVLVDFWATWCRSCVGDMPSIKAMYADLHKRGFEVVGISLDDDAPVVTQFIKDQGIAWSMLSRGSTDGLGLHHPMALKYGVETLPATFLIGKDGKVAAVNLRGSALREKIELLLGEPINAAK